MNSQQTLTPEMRDTIARDDVAQKNATALSMLLREHLLFIQPREFPTWRPTKKVSGGIPGVAESVTVIATNGLTAYFLYDGEAREGEVLFGHVQKFDGKVETLHTLPKTLKESDSAPKVRAKKATKTLSLKQQIMEEL